MGMWHLRITPWAEEAKSAADPGRAAAGFGGRRSGCWKVQRLQVAIAEAIEGELAAADGSQLSVMATQGL